MKFRLLLLCALSITFCSVLADEPDGPRTGYFRASVTTLELLGAEGANAIAEVLPPDEELKWQLYVPQSYDASKPVGVLVFINRSDSWGGSSKSYNPILEETNLIWAAPLGAGDKQPMNERVLRAMLTPNLLARTYTIDPSRVYIGGFVGGGYVAAMLATSKPEVFRGGLFVGGALAWKDNIPPAIAQVRKNRYVFVTGSNDVALDTMRRTADTYRKEGVARSKLIVIPNARQEMPGPLYLREAIEYLDGA